MHFYKHPNDTLPTQFRVDYHKSIERQGVHKILLGKEMVVTQNCGFLNLFGKAKMHLMTIALQFTKIC